MMRQKEHNQHRSISALDVIGILVAPLLGPLALRIWGSGGDFEELWSVLFGPIFYLIAGIAISSFKTARLFRQSTTLQREKAVKRLHDLKTASLFFLALFEGAACLFAVEPEAPLGVLVFAVCFYVPYAVCSILWLKYLSRLQIAEPTDLQISSESAACVSSERPSS